VRELKDLMEEAVNRLVSSSNIEDEESQTSSSRASNGRSIDLEDEDSTFSLRRSSGNSSVLNVHNLLVINEYCGKLLDRAMIDQQRRGG
jgi:hypothetical protein